LILFNTSVVLSQKKARLASEECGDLSGRKGKRPRLSSANEADTGSQSKADNSQQSVGTRTRSNRDSPVVPDLEV
jgi:hypothetical protein